MGREEERPESLVLLKKKDDECGEDIAYAADVGSEESLVKGL